MRTDAASNSRRKQSRKSPTAKVLPLFPSSQEVDPVSSFILNWAPSKGFSEKTWLAIAPITRHIINQVNPGSIEMARKYLRTLTRHIGARYLGGHQITDSRILLDDQNLAQTYANSGKNQLKNSSIATELSFLYRIRQNLHPEIYAKPESLKIAVRDFAEPYTTSELTALLAWARQRSALRNIRIHGALLLSISCGLDASELSAVTGKDFYLTPWGLVVRAQGIANSKNRCERFIPVLSQYENEIAALAKRAGVNPLIGRSENNNLFDISREQPRTPGVPNFNGGRGRSTWMQSLLINGSSYVAMHHAGASVTADKRMAYLSREIGIVFEKYVKNIRGTETEFDPSQFLFLSKFEEPTK